MLHSSQVSLKCEKVATKLNFDQGVINRIRITGVLHDIRKIGVDERIDGKGLPKGIKGDEISIVAKIIAIADTCDATTSDRPYRKTSSDDVAIFEIQKCSGRQFDSEIVKVFLDMMSENTNLST